MKAKVKIYYQKFELNALRFNDPLILDKENAVFIKEEELCATDRRMICNKIFYIMNHLDIPVGHPDRPLFEKAGHTSMSVGDYIEFEDGEIWLCDKVGWDIRHEE